MKRQSSPVVVRLSLPCLTDKAAVQFVDLLHQLIERIEFHYSVQIHRYSKRQQNIFDARQSRASKPTDPPF